jgi:hypothetical protein
MSHIHIALALLIISISLGCSAKHSDSKTTGSCKTTLDRMGKLPKLVLLGTDVVDIAEFTPSTETPESHYVAEMGGAILTLSIESSDNTLNIHRKFQEPGQQPVSQAYHSTCSANEYIYSDSLTGKIVEGGILIFERNPNAEGIPDSLWVFFEKN